MAYSCLVIGVDQVEAARVAALGHCGFSLPLIVATGPGQDLWPPTHYAGGGYEEALPAGLIDTLMEIPGFQRVEARLDDALFQLGLKRAEDPADA